RRTLSHSDTKIGQFPSASRYVVIRLSPHEEGTKPACNRFEDQVEVETNLFIVLGESRGDHAERAASRHSSLSLHLEWREEPVPQVLPGMDIVIEYRKSALDPF